jgi:predicted RNA methylase
MNCCQARGIEAFFDKKTADKVLIAALTAEGIEGMTLLDIGGGVGALQQELLAAGVSSATNVEASTADAEVSKEEAERR